MQRIIDIFKELNATNSVVSKENILNKYKGDLELRELLEANLNPYKIYQFNKMPYTFSELTTFDKFPEKVVYKMFIDLLKKLETRTVTGNEAKQAVKDVFCRMLKFEFDMYASVLLKEAIGVGAKTVNKVWPKLIPEFGLMLAPNELPNIMTINYPANIQPKLDGYRCIYDNGYMWSRTGRPFGNKNLASYFSKLFQVEDYVLDGELYVEGENFNKLQTILNTYEAPLPEGLKFVVYDCMPKTEWDCKKGKKPYSERLKQIRTVIQAIADHKKVIDIPNDIVEEPREAVEIYKKYLKAGYEGAMIKSVDGLYKWKRTTVKSGEMLKVKPFETIDLVIKGYYAGEGKFEGMAGGVDVDYNGVTVSIGSGFDVPTRKAIAATPSNFIGKTIEIKYFEETEDGSLRFPTFVRFREEKD